MSHPKKVFVKEACWALSNIMAGDVEQIQKVLDFDEGRIIDMLFKIVKETQELDVSFRSLY
jgi:hypothetical protein